MKLSRLLPPVLLLAAFLCFAGAYLSNRYSLAPGVMLRADTARLQKQLVEAENRAEHEASEIADQLRRGRLTFQAMVCRTTYPCFVFQQGELLYWSDNSVQPDHQNATESFHERLVVTQFGRYLALRHVVGDYVVLTYIPLKQTYGISNRYLREGSENALFRGLDLRLVADRSRAGLPQLYSAEGRYLFSLESLQPNPATGRYLPLALLLLGLGSYVAAWVLWARRLFRAGRELAGTLTVVLPLLVLRAALLYFGLPFSFIELSLFDPRVYAASWLSPSLGDLLINAVLLAVAARYGLRLFRRYASAVRPRPQPTPLGRGLRVVGLMLAFFGLLELLFQFYANSFNNSQLVLDITQDISLTGFKALLALAIVLHTGAYLAGFYVLAQLFEATGQPATQRLEVLVLGVLLLAVLPAGVVLGQTHVLLLGLALLFFFLLRLTGLRWVAAVVPYQVYLFAFLMLALSSAVGALALYARFDEQLLLNKQTLAGNLLVENDLQGEFLLGERSAEMAADPLLRTLLAGPDANAEAVRQKIVKHYLRDYFDKYEISAALFDSLGQPVGAERGAETLPELRTRLLQTAARTDQPNLFLVRGSNSFSTRRYVDFVHVPAPAAADSATIVLELKLKKLTAYSVLPELLVDQKFTQPGLGVTLSYAGYEDGRLVYSEGDFDYANRLSSQQLRDPRLYRSGLVTGRFHHLAVRDETQHRTVVVTTVTYDFSDWLANFSFLFLLHSFVGLLGLGGYLLARGEYLDVFRTNFSTKIQLFLNLGILVPLVVVSVATISQVTDSYKRDLRRTYERRGRAVQDNLVQHSALLADSASKAALLDLAEQVSAATETDLNLYDARGALLVSSQPVIFESGLLGPLMNPQAVVALRERGQPRTLLLERAGSLSFNTLYLPLRAVLDDAPTGPVLGYVGIPFFDSEKDLDNKLTELISTMLNIFTAMFVLFLGLAFVASRVLTNPLKLVTEKLKQTTLTNQNERLDYQSNDEIGLLVREYNTMLLKLEESKQELAAQEKEAAWREMARQVAHEIKNPLTPMKLSLQFLQRAIHDDRPNLNELIGKVSQTLITQIDVLTDIATSFSTFTNLPAMRPERLDVQPILRRCVELHQDSRAGSHIRLLLPDGGEPTIVFADENLLVRTFNNLLINALQAVPEGRAPEIAAELRMLPEARLRISIEDNGAGIAEEVREKVFVPNFTTKATGSGIGLAVARRGIEGAGGRIWFETEENVGTTFFIELPLAG